MNNLMSGIFERVCPWLLLAVLAAHAPVSSSAVTNAQLDSTESRVTLSFSPNPDATNYTASFRLKQGFTFTDVSLEPPYDPDVELRASYNDVLPGHVYTVELYENQTAVAYRVYSGDIATVPLRQESLEVWARGTDFLSLRWVSPHNYTYDEHEIGFTRENSTLFELRNSTNDLTFNLTDLDPGYSYGIYVVAVTAGVKSQPSDTITAATLPLPPVDLTAEAQDTTHIMLSWSPAPASNYDSFRVTYEVPGSPGAVSTASCTDRPCSLMPGTMPGAAVTMSVVTVAHGLTSTAALIEHSTAPGVIQDLSGEEGVRSLRLEWRPAKNSVQVSYQLTLVSITDSSVRNYSVPADPGSGSEVVSYLVERLVGGFAYSVAVRAVSQFAVGEAKSEIYRTIPEPVSNLTSQAVNTTALKLFWMNPENSEYDFINITVVMPDGDVAYLKEDKSSTSRTLTGLVAGEEYLVTLTIHTPYSQRLSEEVTGNFRTKPVPPVIMSSVSEERELSLSLARSENVGVMDAIRATLLQTTDTQIVMTNNSGLVRFAGLEPGTLYTVETFTVSGEERSLVVTADRYTRPRPPQNLYVIASTDTEINVGWEEPDAGSYDNFTIVLVELDGITQPQSHTGTELKHIFPDLQPGTAYNVTVVANKGDQSSDLVWAENTTSPLGVTHIRVAVRGIDSVTVAWDPPIGSGLSGYALTFEASNLTLHQVPPSVNQYKFEGLEPEANYTLELFVYSERSDGVLLYSPEIQFNFSTYPESVAALQKVDATSDSLTVNWTAPVSGDFNFFQLGIRSGDPNSVQSFNVPRTRTNVTFENLAPGVSHVVAIRTAVLVPGRAPQFGVSVRMLAVTKPLPVEELEAVTVNTTALTLRWTTNRTSSQDRFDVTYGVEDSSKSESLAAVNTTNSYELTLSQLRAGYNYSVEVRAVRSIETDTEISDVAMETGVTVPLPVQNLTLTAEGRDLRITWAPPSSGLWDSYTVRYRPVLRNPASVFLLRTASHDQRSVRITELFPGEKYQVKVVTISNDLESESMEAHTVLDPLPPTSLAQLGDTTTPTSLVVSWEYPRSVTYTEGWELDYTDAAGTFSRSQQVDATEDQTEYALELRGLTAGQNYTVTLTSLVADVYKSTSVSIGVTAKPVIHSFLEELSSTNSSLTIQYTVKPDDVFSDFLFTLTDESGQEVDAVSRSKAAPQRTVEFSALEGGTRYTLEAVTRSGAETSDAISLELITDPNPVPVTLSATATKITLTFGPQQGQAWGHRVTCMPVRPGASSCGQQEPPAGQPTVSFDNLSPYKDYSFEVVTLAQELEGRRKNVTEVYQQQTEQAPPSAVQSLAAVSRGLNTVDVSWERPLVMNGVLTDYVVSYRGREPDVASAPLDSNTMSLGTTATSVTFDKLKAGYEYTFQVFAVTVGQGKKTEKVVTMPTGAPQFQSNMDAASTRPTEPESGAQVTQTRISYKFVNPFNSDNGYVRYYTVVVSKDPSADSRAARLPSWQEAQEDSSIKVYQTVGRCQDFFTAGSSCGSGSGRSERATHGTNDLLTRVFVVGAESAASCKVKDFCNGPLSEDTEYYVKLRGYTASGDFTETEYSEVIKTAAGSSSNAGVVGGAVGAVLLLIVIVIIVVVFVLRRKNRPKKAVKHTGPRQTWEQSTMNKFSRPVKLADFPSHVRKMTADSDFKYAEEYEDLKEVGRDQPCLAAEFPPNRPKNRFTNILPYDHSRVKLLPTDDEEGSDYINANYMPGYNSKREYIATQGPLPATRDDFWRMVWEQSTRNVVMLTKCQEKGREKSDHYWPSDPEPKFYGDLQVGILNETHMPDWTVTEFKVALGEVSRTVRHFHYRVWPDFGVPKDPTSLIRFVRTVREKLIREGGPIVTHCSAGVGRSGTFIVLDHLLQLIREKDEVDIFSIVYKLRKERVLMVQTEQQYKFIHECLVCVLEGREEDTTYANVGQVNIGFEDIGETCVDEDSDDEGINVEVS
ncbi:tyrosine-protein phosphatase 10D [Aplysia californica]|uniref:Tyrosine-protein phosphatase 10D n=1 Tax=Aplysia californica TaxID=6500 RepID=A0ABM1VV35_APLCA|nr:tyrosine-protein phosphatase 10D [Aplysia californica]